MATYLAPDSLGRRLTNEPAAGLLAGRALVLQLAHPVVAQGVGDHSDFKAHPFKRLLGTVRSMYSITNGSEDLAIKVGENVRRVHDFIQGPNYRANDPENLLWVHATLVDSVLLAHALFVRPISVDRQEAFYQEMKQVAALFGLTDADQPANIDEFRTYFQRTVDSLEITTTGKDLIGFVFHPELSIKGLNVAFAPAFALQRFVTAATLPDQIRSQVGLAWDRQHEAAFRSFQGAVRATMRGQPEALRQAPVRLGAAFLARQAQRKLAGAAGKPGRRQRASDHARAAS